MEFQRERAKKADRPMPNKYKSELYIWGKEMWCHVAELFYKKTKSICTPHAACPRELHIVRRSGYTVLGFQKPPYPLGR